MATTPNIKAVGNLSDTNFGYEEVSRVFNSGDGTGRYWTLRYRGTKNALREASLNWTQRGGKVTITEDGPYADATVIFAGNPQDPNNPQTVDPAQEEPSTRFEFRTEFVEASIFDLPAVIAEANRYALLAQQTQAEYYYQIRLASEDPRNNKLPPQLTTPLTPLAEQLVVRLAAGRDSFQTSRVSLTRISSFSALNGLPATPPIIPVVYSGLQLAASNGFPLSVRAAMPQPPIQPELTPAGSAWSWLKTNDSTSLIVKTNQVERNETWTFAAWDLLIYPYFA